MVLVAVGAQENLFRSDTAPEFFQMPDADANMLSFSVFDVLKRIEVLRAALYGRAYCPEVPARRHSARAA
jgi:hypothetical protein